MATERSQRDLPTRGARSSELTICDLADEEVHFSRNPSDFYYQLNTCNEEAGGDERERAICDGNAIGQARTITKVQPPIYALDTSSLADVGHTAPGIARPAGSRPTRDQPVPARHGHGHGPELQGAAPVCTGAQANWIGRYMFGITIQSWSEFFAASRLMRAPNTRHQLSRRLAANLAHFQGNYLCLALVLILYCLLTSLTLLLAIGAYLFALFLATKRSAMGKATRIFGYHLDLRQQYSFITILSIPPLWIAGAPSAVFWVIGASFLVVGLHAALFMSDQLAGEQLACGQAPTVELHGHGELERFALKRPASEYYNHYASDGRGYISLADSAPTSGDGTASAAAARKYLPTKDHETCGKATVAAEPTCSNHRGQRQTFNVRIISRDYIGLGQVHEV